MILQFEQNGSFFLVDLIERVWLKTVAPTIDSGEIIIKEVLDKGAVVSSGYKTWSLAGRKPPELCSLAVDIIGVGDTATVYIRPNVPVQNFTMPKPIKTILYEVLNPKTIDKSSGK